MQITSQADLWAGTYGRLRSVCVSPQGRVYLGTSNQDGRGTPGAIDDRLIVLENRTYLATAGAQAAAAFTLAPNPATSSVQLRRAAATGAALVRVLDNLGRTVQQSSFASGQQDLSLSINGLATGLYVVETTSAEGQSSRARLVVQ